MDFFASQDLARRNTRKLVGLLIVTVLTIILAVYGLGLGLMGMLSAKSKMVSSGFTTDSFFSAENGLLVLGIASAVIAVVFFGSLIKTNELRKGGAVVADMLGGRRLMPNTSDLTERRILNIVEEMSLASGVPVPPVYVMEDEPGINAFAAGHTIDDCVIGVNRGTLETLNREELQGVIAHEFSHILNGDMRMSLRMIGLLHGIQGIALIGMYMMRIASRMSHGRSSRDKGGGMALAFIAFGAGLFAIGSIGLFFAKLIKASVSRQREYLADASAVQFTRLPDGIAGALKVIGASQNTSKVGAPDAEAISHMFFANMNGSLLQSFFATHPPLVPRIQRIENQFTGNFSDYLKTRHRTTVADKNAEEQQHRKNMTLAKKFGFGFGQMGVETTGFSAAASQAPPDKEFQTSALLIIDNIGSPNDDDVTYSQILKEHVSDAFMNDCRDVFSARCIVFASLLDEEPELRDRQLSLIHQREKEATLKETLRQANHLQSIPPKYRLAIFEILQGTLVGLSPEQLQFFEESLHSLVVADKEIDLFEFFLLNHLIVHLRRHLGLTPKNRITRETLGGLEEQVELVLSIVARQGHATESEAATAFEESLKELGQFQRPLRFTNVAWNFKSLREAIKELSQTSFKVRKQFLTAVATCILHDQVITHTEAELFRAIAESLDCPVPPIIATVT